MTIFVIMLDDGEAGKPFNKDRDGGCYEFNDLFGGYEGGYQSGCETHTTEASCELKYEDKSYYCLNHPDIAGCADFLHNATNKQPTQQSDYDSCASQKVICISESNPEKYCLGHDDPTFCKTIGDLCDEDGFVKPEYPYCTTVQVK
jgi:hypothetical protein